MYVRMCVCVYVCMYMIIYTGLFILYVYDYLYWMALSNKDFTIYITDKISGPDFKEKIINVIYE